MTKQTLLATAALATMALAGAANAGSITGTVGTVSYSSTVSKIIAAEAADPTSGSAQSAAFTASTDLTNNITVASGSQVSFNITFDVTGATFTGAPTITAEATSGPDFVATSFLESDGDAFGVITIDNTSGSGTVTIEAFSLSGVSVNATSAATISVASDVAVVNGGTATTIDTAGPVNAVTYATYFNGFTATAGTAEAKLPNYVSFSGTSGSSSATLATGITAQVTSGSFYSTLDDTSTITITEFVTDVTVNVGGTGGAKLNLLNPRLNDSIAPTTATDTLASFNLAPVPGNSTIVLGNSATFSLQPSGNTVINAADYTVSFVPTYGSGFTPVAPQLGPINAGKVTLEGTNFDAPWVALAATGSTSTIRVANTGTTATGPVFVTLRSAASGPVGQRIPVTAAVLAPSSTPLTAEGGIPAGGQLVLSGALLRTALGTDTPNGDLRITIQGDGAVLSAKHRGSASNGSNFEASLGNLETPGQNNQVN